MRLMIVGHTGSEIAEASGIATRRGASVRHVPDRKTAMAELRAGNGADLLLVDVRCEPECLIQALVTEHIHVPVVAYGIATDACAAIAAIRAGAREFIPLPPDPELIAAILATVSQPHGDLVHGDTATARLLALARQIAPSDASILITGESGTGKEIFARFVHRNSRRAKSAFVSINCAAIPENLLESELFGHEKGAFTGAAARRIGKFEEANGGTLLLDEISEMDPRLQAKLLRVIQEREIDRVGGTRPIKIDIRLLATSNRDLRQAVAEGSFREDLLFRLNVLNLHIPPLRERPGDLEPLCNHLLAKHARSNRLPARPLSVAALERLSREPWKGNVRELENCMHRAVLLAQGSEIGVDAIHVQDTLGAVSSQTTEQSGGDGLVGRTVAEVERRLILETLHHTLGNRTHAATILGISIRTLRNKLRQYTGEGVAVPTPFGETARSCA